MVSYRPCIRFIDVTHALHSARIGNLENVLCGEREKRW